LPVGATALGVANSKQAKRNMSDLPKLLLVDDRPENLLALEGLLRRSDAEILKAESGKRALELLLEHEVALALIDVQMPELDGFALAELMRNVERTREIPIIFVTAGLHDRDRVFKGYESGAVDFLVKPLDARILASKVSVFLQLYRQKQLLIAANAQLVEADRRKNEFLAVLSHELRNPLAPIKNSLYILDRAAPGGEQARRALRVIDRQATQLSNLVNDLLDVTRITRNKIRLQKERLDVNQLVRRAVEDSRSFFVRSEVRLSYDLAATPVLVHADATRVAQIVGNLLQNAAKFTSHGGRTHVSVVAEAGQSVIRVVDNGVGMAPDTVARLCQPFMQADQSLDRSKGGLGLGLALVKGLVELHGGSIEAQSDGLGKGSAFVVRLPLDETLAPEKPALRASGPQVSRRVLIIEDNLDAAESLREALELSAHEVAVANNGPDGIEKARSFRPDVVLCDIGLPGMDGYEVARAIRLDATLQSTLLIALSGYALPEDLERAASAGFQHHLAKPPSVDALERVLSDLSATPLPLA
jgi:signal transduction histidine kinase